MPRERDTSMGGGERNFPSTMWSELRGLDDTAAARERLDRLLRAYWKPIYHYLRAVSGRPVEQAKDLTQSFVLHLLEDDRLKRVAAEVRSFRAYLKSAIRNFVANSARDAHAQKRAGEAAAVSLEDTHLDPEGREIDPATAFDRDWAEGVMESSVDQLRKSLAEAGKETYWSAFELQRAGKSYSEIAASVGIAVTDVRNYLTTARRELRGIIAARVREYVAGEREVGEEMSYLLDLLKV